MATAAERKALLFFGVVAILGGSVKLIRAQHPQHSEYPAEASDDNAPESSQKPRTSKTRSFGTRASRAKSPRPESRTGHFVRDSTSVVDLDRASAIEIDRIGVLPSGMARLIVADRDSFGPFGSIEELKRVPFLSSSTLRKLAPRVTFSRVPRPRNTVIQPRANANAVAQLPPPTSRPLRSARAPLTSSRHTRRARSSSSKRTSQ